MRQVFHFFLIIQHLRLGRKQGAQKVKIEELQARSTGTLAVLGTRGCSNFFSANIFSVKTFVETENSYMGMYGS